MKKFLIRSFQPITTILFRYYSHKMNVVPSDIDGLCDIKTFVFLDLETTGLPSEEHNRTKITELSMVAVEANHIRLGVFPRVQNKLSLCFNPKKMVTLDSEKLTGLSNDSLEQQKAFTSDTVNLINSFLSNLQLPVCFVAHNGNKFDYPILRAQINMSGATLLNILCIDSLLAFQAIHFDELNSDGNDAVEPPLEIPITSIGRDVLDSSTVPAQYKPEENEGITGDLRCQAQRINETTPKKRMIHGSRESIPYKKFKQSTTVRRINSSVSFKLGDIYERLTKKSVPRDAHRAESDVLMLIMCAATIGDKFVDWATRNSKKFCDIPPMIPGRRIGT